MTRILTILAGIFILSLFLATPAFGQPGDGDNEYRLAAANPRAVGIDTLTSDAGRGIYVADNPDLDNDGKAEILVTEYSDGGRVFVYEMVGNDRMELVWASKKLKDGINGGGQTPRSVTVGDFDNNGRQEIIFQVGYLATDSTEFAERGIFFYEWTGNDNDYGTEPTYKLSYETIDAGFATVNVGRGESGMRVQDIDGDGKAEMLFPPRAFSFAVAKLYILEVESGNLADSTAVIENEYTYEAMVQPPFLAPDGYVPVGTAVGNVDADPADEIVVAGWTNIGAGAGLGFIQIDGPDTYSDGNVIPLADYSAFVVKANPLIVEGDGNTAIMVMGSTGAGDVQQIWGLENILSDIFVTENDVNVVRNGTGLYSIWATGDQDHGPGGTSDGFDLYAYDGGGSLIDMEYNGTGSLLDSNNYTTTEIYNLTALYDSSDGLFNDIYTYPGMDVDDDGNLDIIVGYKGSPADSAGGRNLAKDGFHIFMFEWGDSSMSFNPLPVVRPNRPEIITPDDYVLRQNYPNPFNPNTTIAFQLPLNKSISLKIFNSLGQEVRTLINQQPYAAGDHQIEWDGRNNNGAQVASGVYIYKLIFGNFSKTQKMTLVR